MANVKDQRLAILIDADNVSAQYIKYILNETSNHGTPTVKRIYGDFTDQRLKSWKDKLLNYSVTPIQQFQNTTGKNSTDASLIIDAMDILYAGSVDGFCIISSDSDFTRLAARLRESGMYVLGMGEKKTPKAFIAACEQFKYLEVLRDQGRKIIVAKKAKTGKDPESNNITALEVIVRALTDIVEDSSGDDGWANLGEVGSKLSKRFSDFDTRNYNYKRLSDFVKSLKKFDIELREASSAGGANNYVRIKSTGASKPTKAKRHIKTLNPNTNN